MRHYRPDRFERRDWQRGRGEGRLIMGVFVVALGVLFLLENLGYIYVRNIWSFWPLFLIVMGVSRLASCRTSGGVMSGVILTVIGGVFLANNLGFIPWEFSRMFWPVLLILVGVGMLARSLDRGGFFFSGNDSPSGQRAGFWSGDASADSTHQWVIFSGSHRRVKSQDYQGGDALAIFGGVKLDLTEANTTRPEVRVEANALFGGIEIRVPETWNVSMQGMGVLGGFEDETRNRDPQPGKPNLVVTGTAMFGGVVVKS